MSDDQDPKAHIDASFQPPRVVLGIDRGYKPVTETMFVPGERALVEAVINAGLDMRDDQNIRRPCIIPPAVALAVVRELFGPGLGAARSAYHGGSDGVALGGAVRPGTVKGLVHRQTLGEFTREGGGQGG